MSENKDTETSGQTTRGRSVLMRLVMWLWHLLGAPQIYSLTAIIVAILSFIDFNWIYFISVMILMHFYFLAKISESLESMALKKGRNL